MPRKARRTAVVGKLSIPFVCQLSHNLQRLEFLSRNCWTSRLVRACHNPSVEALRNPTRQPQNTFPPNVNRRSLPNSLLLLLLAALSGRRLRLIFEPNYYSPILPSLDKGKIMISAMNQQTVWVIRNPYGIQSTMASTYLSRLKKLSQIQKRTTAPLAPSRRMKKVVIIILWISSALTVCPEQPRQASLKGKGALNLAKPQG